MDALNVVDLTGRKLWVLLSPEWAVPSRGRRVSQLRSQQKRSRSIFTQPVVFQVTVANRLHAQFLEGHCPRYVWSAIVCSDRDDQSLLDRELKPFFGTVIRRDLNAQSYMQSKFQVSEQVRSVLC